MQAFPHIVFYLDKVKVWVCGAERVTGLLSGAFDLCCVRVNRVSAIMKETGHLVCVCVCVYVLRSSCV